VSSLFVCCLLFRIAPPRRPAVALEPVIEPSRSLCRCRCRRRRARSLALQWCRTFVPTSARRVPARRRHPHTEHATVERRPCLSGARSWVSTDLCRVHFPARHRPVYVPGCAHVVGVVPSPRLCRRPFTRTHQHRVEVLSFLAEPVHAHSRTREVVRRRMSPTNAAGPFLAVFLFLCSLA
jgi:hypothetical protein